MFQIGMTSARSLIFTLMSFLWISSAFAEPELYGRIHGGLLNKNGGVIEGETIELKTGKLSWDTMDIYLPGNGGLDIEIYRSFGSGELIERPMADWSIALPRISMATNPGGKTLFDTPFFEDRGATFGICDTVEDEFRNANMPYASASFAIIYKAWIEQLAEGEHPLSAIIYLLVLQIISSILPPVAEVNDFHTGLFLTIPGEGAKSLLVKTGESTEIGQRRFNSGVANRAQYVTADNWLVECMEDELGRNNNFIAHSPDGTKYYFDKRSVAMGDPMFMRQVGQNIWYPSEVEDKFGNKLNYEYIKDGYVCSSLHDFLLEEMDRQYGEFNENVVNWLSAPACPVSYKVEKISASDGREVVFHYENPAQLPESVDQYKYGSRRIHKITVGEHEWNYRYSKYEPGVSNYLSEVELPDGTTWVYTKKTESIEGSPRFSEPYGGNDWARHFAHLRRYDDGLPRPFDSITGIYNRAIGLMDEVTTPTGTVITYEYESNEANFFNHIESKTIIPSVTSRSISGPNMTDRLWSFDYTKNNTDDEFYVTINEPDASNGDTVRTVHTLDHQEGSSHFGMVTSVETYANDVLILKRETDWKTLGEIGSDNYVKERPVSVQTLRAVEIERVTNEDDLVFTTVYSNFDKFGQPRTVTQTAPAYRDYLFRSGELFTPEKITNKTYYHDTMSWVIGLDEDVTTVDSYVGNLVVDRSFSSKGILRSVTDKNVTKNYKFHDTGDLESTSWINQGVDYEIQHLNYKLGKPQSIIKADGYAHAQEISDQGLVVSKTTPTLVKTEYAHDALGRITKKASPGLVSEDAVWNFNGNPRQVNITKGDRQTLISMDAFGNVISTRTSDNGHGRTIYTRTEYSPRGKEIFTANPSFNANETVGVYRKYDSLGREVEFVDAEGNRMTYCYSLSCLPNDAPFAGRSYEGRLVKVQTIHLPAGGDESGSLSNDIVNIFFSRSYADPLESTLLEVYQQRTEGTGDDRYLVTGMDITPGGATRSITQGGALSATRLNYEFTYFPGTLKQQTAVSPYGLTLQYTYDEQGNVRTQQVNDTPVVTYHHDGENRVVYEDYDNSNNTPDKALKYDFRGFLLWADNGFTRWDYKYNLQGFLREETLSVAGSKFSTVYHYDTAGHLESMVFPNGEVMQTNNDAFNQPTLLGDYVSNISFHPNNTIQSFTYGNGAVANFDVNDRNFVGSVSYAGLRDRDIFEAYTYDFRGNPYLIEGNVSTSGISAFNETETYRYDALGFIDSGISKLGAVSYDFDDFGNILSKTVGDKQMRYGYLLESNELRTRLQTVHNDTAATTVNYAYNGFGSITSNGSHSFIYDNANRLREVPSANKSMYYDIHHKRTVTIKPDETEIAIFSKNGPLLSKINTEKNTVTNYVYLGQVLLAKNEVDCGELCDSIGAMGEPRTTPPTDEDTGGADLALKLVESEVVSGKLVYSLSVVNDGPDVAEGAILSHSFPLSAEIGSYIASKGECSIIETVNALFCEIGDLEVNEEVIFNIEVVGIDASDIKMSGIVLVTSNTIDADSTNNTLVGKKKICFIATAAFGSAEHDYLYILRDFRDDILMQSKLGRAFIESYYIYSPRIAAIVATDSAAKTVVRAFLLPVIFVTWLLMNPLYLILALSGIGLLVRCYINRREFLSMEA